MTARCSCKDGSRLILLARRFPFNHGEVAAESYLETEIVYLAQYFDEILAIGTEAPHGDAPTCSLPENVTPLALGCANELADKVELTARGFMYPFGASVQVKKSLESDRVKGLERRLFRGYFTARADRKFNAICNCLDDLEISPTHIYSFWFYDIALAASWLSEKYPWCHAVSRAHGYDLYEERNRTHYLPSRRYLLDHLDCVLTCSKNGERYLDTEWPGYGDKVRTLYLGTPSLPDKSNEPQEKTLELVSCSRVVDIKRVEIIAEAIRILDDKGTCVSWTHFGDGPNIAKLKSMCCDLAKCKVCLRGNIPNKVLLDEYASCHFDLFINVSSCEGLPISIMEACGCGIPVLATDVGGTSEIVSDGVNGFLLEPDCSAADVADAIVRFSELGPEAKLKMRGTARSVWEIGFQTERNAAELAHVLGV